MTEYDLAKYAEARRRFDLPTRVVVMLFGAGILVEWALLLRNLVGQLMLGEKTGSLANASIAGAGLAAGPALFLICMYFCAMRLGKAPTSARVDSRGLDLRYESGRAVSVRWQDSNLHIVVRDDRLNARVNPLLAVDLKVKGKGLIPVPFELAEEVRNFANSLGLVVDEVCGGSAFDSLRGSRLTSIRAAAELHDRQ